MENLGYINHKMNKTVIIKLGRGRLRFSSETLLDSTCVLWLCSMPLRLIVAFLLSFLKIGFLTIPVVNILIYVPLIVYILIEKKIPWKYFHWVLILCILFFGTTLLVHPEYEYWYSRDIYGIMYTVFRPDHGAIWAFLMIEISQNIDRIWKNIKIYSVILFFYNIYLLYTASSTGYWTAYNASGELAERTYSLDFGYDMIFICLVAIVCYLLKKKMGYIIICFLCTLLALLYGSRGALICLFVFVLFYMFNGSQKLSKKLLWGVLVLLGGIFMYLYGMELIQMVAIFFSERLHLSSRTLTQIISSNLTDDSGRSDIYNIVKDAIIENPILGYGAYGDRPLIGPTYYWGYSHSIVYEFIVDFGIIFGMGFLSCIIYKSLKLIFNGKNRLNILVFLIIFSTCMRLTVSDTFWGNKYFWMCIAMLFIFKGDSKKALSGGN